MKKDINVNITIKNKHTKTAMARAPSVFLTFSLDSLFFCIYHQHLLPMFLYPQNFLSYTKYIIPLKKATLKKMIECYAFTPDYFDGFNGLPRLCELYQMYDELQVNGLNLYFWNSY